MTYDSTADTLTHSRRVGELLAEPIRELVTRSTAHDLSKLSPAEKPTYDALPGVLAGAKYGSPEYLAAIRGAGDGIRNHYAVNRHHPEHFGRGVNDMSLTDLLEMLADWIAAHERRPSGNLRESLEVSRKRFGIERQLFDVLCATAVRYGWLNTDHA